MLDLVDDSAEEVPTSLKGKGGTDSNIADVGHLGVVEISIHRIGRGRNLTQGLPVQVIRLPVLVGCHIDHPVESNGYVAWLCSKFRIHCMPA